VTQYVPDGTLETVILNEQLDWSIRISIAYQIAQAMDFLHCQLPPFISRSLSAVNILVDRSEGCKVLLNIVQLTKEVGVTSQFASFPWKPPEVSKHQDFTERSDVYCYGVILWQLWTLLDPYEIDLCAGFSLDSIVLSNNSIGDQRSFPVSESGEAEHGTTAVSDPKHVLIAPADYIRLVHSCLSANPELRPTSYEILQTLRSINQDKMLTLNS